MLEYPKRDEIVSVNDVDNRYPGCMYLLVDVNNNFSDFRGRLHCVSHSPDSFDELCDEDRKMTHSGRTTAMLGIYTNYTACAAQYMVECEGKN